MRQEQLDLAHELLREVETDAISGQALLLKASRLARLVANESVSRWLEWELHGYPDPERAADPDVRRMMVKTGRWETADGEGHYYATYASVTDYLNDLRGQLQGLPRRELSGEWAYKITLDDGIERNRLLTAVAVLNRIESSVRAVVHSFATETYVELAFSEQQRTLFEKAQVAIDARLSATSDGTLKMIESIYERLGSDDGDNGEAIAHALTTCRRLIDAVADVLYPARSTPANVDGREVQLTKQHTLNRLEMFVAEHTDSGGRRKRIRTVLERLHERASAGVHSEVTAEEARFLFLHTYITLGEVVLLDENISALPASVELGPVSTESASNPS